jgi:hypothetical protein
MGRSCPWEKWPWGSLDALPLPVIQVSTLVAEIMAEGTDEHGYGSRMWSMGKFVLG